MMGKQKMLIETIIKSNQRRRFNKEVDYVRLGFLTLFDSLFPVLRWETDAEIITDFLITYIDTFGKEQSATPTFNDLLDRQNLKSNDINDHSFQLYKKLFDYEHNNLAVHIFKRLFDKVSTQVDEYIVDELELGERCCNPRRKRFEWESHLKLRYFHAITILETCLNSPLFRTGGPTADEIRDRLYDGDDSFSTWRSYIYTERQLSSAKRQDNKLLRKSNCGFVVRDEDIATVISSYQRAEQLSWSGYIFGILSDDEDNDPSIRHCVTAALLNARIALIYCQLLQDETTARDYFVKARESVTVKDWNVHFNCDWATECRIYLSHIDPDMRPHLQREGNRWREPPEGVEEQGDSEEGEHYNKHRRSRGAKRLSLAFVDPNSNDSNVKLSFLALKSSEIEGMSSLMQLLRWLNQAFTPLESSSRIQLQNLLMADRVSDSDLRNIILIYHPDKNNRYGDSWKEQCEEVTKVKTHCYYLI
jgi:hypothetical protein